MSHEPLPEAATLPPTPRQELKPSATLSYLPMPGSEAATLAPGEGAVAAPPVSVPGYELLGELGRGGMGVVYKARHLGLNRLVALKMVLAGGHAGKEQLARFKAEAEAVAQLQHPNIVQIHDIGQQEGHPYFSLEYIEGGSLEQHLKGQPQPPRQAAALLEQVARGMQAAHDRGIIHRDLKPGNILLQIEDCRVPTENQTAGQQAFQSPITNWQSTIPKITDFGLAKSLDSDSAQTKTGTILGTPSYMAPEQAEGRKDLTSAVDVYALGAILYECLTGRPPFRAATPFDTVVQVVSEEPVPPRRLQSQTPRDLETICLKCLEKSPQRRYPLALALAEDLRRFLQEEPILARPVGPVSRLVKWCRRRPAIAALLLLCGLGLAVALWQGWRATTALAEVERQKDQAEQARDAAEKERIRAQALLGKAIEAVDRLMLRVSDPRLARIAEFQEERRKMLDEAVAFQRDLLRLDSTDPQVRHETGLALFKMAELYWNLSRHQEALKACQEAITFQEKLVKDAPQELRLRLELADSHFYQGIIQTTLAQAQEAEQSYRRALALVERVAEQQPHEPRCQTLLVKTHIAIGFFNSNNPPILEKHLRVAADVAQQLLQHDPKNPEAQCLRAACCGHLATLFLRAGRVAAAEEHLREARQLLEPTDRPPPRQAPLYDTVLAQHCVARGSLAMMQGRPAEATPLLQRAVALYEDYLRVQPKAFMYQAMLVPVYQMLFQLQRKAQPTEAEAVLHKGIALADSMANTQQGAAWMTAGSRQYRQMLWGHWVEQGRVQEAATAAAEYAEQHPAGGNSYNAACFHNLAAEASAKDTRHTAAERQHLVETHRQQAVLWLRKACDQGYFKERRNLEHLKTDKDLDSLRTHKDYLQLVSEVEAVLPPLIPKGTPP